MKFYGNQTKKGFSRRPRDVTISWIQFSKSIRKNTKIYISISINFTMFEGHNLIADLEI